MAFCEISKKCQGWLAANYFIMARTEKVNKVQSMSNFETMAMGQGQIFKFMQTIKHRRHLIYRQFLKDEKQS